MSRERIRELWSAWQLGTLDPPDAEELGRLLEEDASARREVLDDLEVHGMLGQLRAEEDAEMFRRSLLERLSAEDSSTRFVRAVLKNPRLGGKRPLRRPRARLIRAPGGGFSLIWPSLAAAVILLTAVGFFLGRPTPERAPSVPAPIEAALPETPPVREQAAAPPERVAPAPVLTKKPIEEPPGPAPAEEQRPPPVPPAPAPPPSVLPGTRAKEEVPVLATIERVQGEVLVIDESGRLPARAPQGLTGRQGLRTIGKESLAVLRFPDGTILELGGETSVPRISDPVRPGKTVSLASGSITATVAAQPQAKPMLFTTPHAEARVLGTVLRLQVDPDPKLGSTRLDVAEGRVRLTKLLERNPMVEVPTGHFTVAAAGVELVVRRIVDDILLLPAKGRIVGSDWRLAKDERSSRGVVLDAPRAKIAHTENWTTEFVEFGFQAEAGKEYTVWVRGCCGAAPGQNRFHCDAVGLEVVNGTLGRPSTWGNMVSLNAYPFNGWGSKEGYWWAGGDADGATPNEPGDDRVPITIRFARYGPQVLRLHGMETPVRVDAIWLSATQKTRPEPERPGPGPARAK